MSSAICGGVISQSQLNKDMKKYGVWADMMSYVMPDKWYALYVKYLKAKEDKKAKKIFERHAYSMIQLPYLTVGGIEYEDTLFIWFS